MGDTTNELAEIAEKLRKQGISEGYNLALKQVSEAISAALASLLPPDSNVDVKFDLAAKGGGDVKKSAQNGNLPATGSTPWYALNAVKKKPGSTGAEVVLAVREAGHTAKEPQIRTALSRLERRKLVANRHSKWFPND